MRPIPKFLLIHSAVLKKEASEDVWGKKTAETVALSGVRVEPAQRRMFSLTDGLPEADTKLFYDCRNSSPGNVVFETGDVVVFGGKEHRIVRVSSFYDEKRLHHLEVYMQ
jgi:hypothetical protein